jgi:phosphate transport system protein
MVVQTFEDEMQRLKNEILDLGDAVKGSIVESMEVLRRRDLRGAQRLMIQDQRIYKKRFAIEMDCLTLIATQQPVDGDLRTITAMLEIATELERMGGYAKDMVGSPFMVIDGSFLSLLGDVHRMATKTQDMLHRALQAFVRGDLDLARAIPAEDDEVDALYHQLYGALLEVMKKDSRAKGDSRATINQARYLARIARNLAHTADRVDTICWWVIFAATGGTAGVEAADRTPLAKMMPASAEYPPSSQEVPDGSRAGSICALKEGLL